MNREEILNAAQSGPKNDENEKRTDLRAGTLSLASGLLLAILMVAIQYFVKNTVNTGILAVITFTEGLPDLISGIRLRKPWRIVTGIVLLLMFVFFLTLWLTEVLK